MRVSVCHRLIVTIPTGIMEGGAKEYKKLISNIQATIDELHKEDMVHEMLGKILFKWGDKYISNWSNDVEDVALLSTYFPFLIFALDRETENNELSRTYIRNNKMHFAETRTVFSEFDESKLFEVSE